MSEKVFELRTILVRAENRQDHALRALSGMDLALPEMGEVLESLREVRDILSTLPASTRGIAKEEDDDLSAFSIQTALPPE
jgi:hypothetical protein